MRSAEISKANLRLDQRPLVEALTSAYAQLNESQCERLAAAILREVAAAIGRGDSLAILKALPDGSFEISRMVVERAARAAVTQR